MVSIHAPTRGATATARMEFLEVLFQSTHPHGVRLFYTTMTRIRTCFNPRTHTGCDMDRLFPDFVNAYPKIFLRTI